MARSHAMLCCGAANEDLVPDRSLLDGDAARMILEILRTMARPSPFRLVCTDYKGATGKSRMPLGRMPLPESWTGQHNP